MSGASWRQMAGFVTFDAPESQGTLSRIGLLFWNMTLAALQQQVANALALLKASLFLFRSKFFCRFIGYVFLTGAPAINGELRRQRSQKHAKSDLQDEFHRDY
jgi:hypothetical protein